MTSNIKNLILPTVIANNQMKGRGTKNNSGLEREKAQRTYIQEILGERRRGEERIKKVQL
jgi:hypothetical protein